VMDTVKYYPILHKFLLKIPHRKMHKLQVCEHNRFICFNKILTGHVALGDDNVTTDLSSAWHNLIYLQSDLAEPGPKKVQTLKMGNNYHNNLLHNLLTLVSCFIVSPSLIEVLISIFKLYVTCITGKLPESEIGYKCVDCNEQSTS
jgi:hypothetical protein